MCISGTDGVCDIIIDHDGHQLVEALVQAAIPVRVLQDLQCEERDKWVLACARGAGRVWPRGGRGVGGSIKQVCVRKRVSA
jgi:hypothetical protein